MIARKIHRSGLGGGQSCLRRKNQRWWWLPATANARAIWQHLSECVPTLLHWANAVILSTIEN